MADETINIDLLINTAKSTKTLSDIKKSLNVLKKASKSITKDSKDYDKLTQAIAETALKGAEAASNFRDMRKAVKDLKDAMEQLGPEDKQFTKLNQAAGALEFKMKKVSDAIKYTSGTPLHNLSAGFHGLRDSVLNLDFEEVNTALKSMGSQMTALAKGALKNLGDRFKSFGAGIANIGKGLGKALTGDLKGGLESAKNGFKGLGDALKVNPLFLIVSVVTLIISKFDDLKNSGGIVGKIFSGIGDAIGWVIDKLKELSDWLGLTNLKEQKMAEEHLASVKEVGEAEDKAFERRKKISEAEFDLAKSKAKNKKEEIALTKKQAKEEYDQELNHLDFQIASANLQIQAIERIRKATGKLTDDQEKQLEELKNSIKDLNADVTVAIDKYVAKDKDADKELTEYNKEQNKKREENLKKHTETVNEINKTLNSYEKKSREENMSEFDKQRDEVKQSSDDELADLKEKLKDKSISQAEYNAFVIKLNQSTSDQLKAIDQKQADDHEKSVQTAQDFVNKIIEKSNEEGVSATKKALDDKIAAIDNSSDAEQAKLLDDYNKGLISYQTYQQALTDSNQQATAAIAAAQKEANDAEIKANEEKLKKESEARKKEVEDEKTALKDLSASAMDLDSILASNKSKNLKAGSKEAEDAAKKQFEVNKAFSLGSAVVSGYESILKASTPVITPVGPVVNPIILGSTIAEVGANIAKIASAKFGGSSGGISSSNSGNNTSGGFGAQALMQTGTNTPVFNGVPGTNQNNSQNQTGSNGNNNGGGTQVIKAYVTAGDIDSATNKSSVLDRRSKY